MVTTAPDNSPAATASPASVAELLASHERLIFWFAQRRYYQSLGGRVGMDLEDFKQEIILSVLKGFHRFDPARGQFSNWLGWQALHAAQWVRERVRDKQGDVKTVGGTVASPEGEEVDRFATLADPKAADPAAGVSLVRVLVPVERLTIGACPVAVVRDQRSNKPVQVPAVDVVTYCGRLFAVAVGFDEGDDGLHKVRFGNDAVAWVLAAVTE